jgi:hypothetical protein
MTWDNSDILEVLSEYRGLPIIIAGRTAAEVWGFTQTSGKVVYVGDKKYESKTLKHISDDLKPCDKVIKVTGGISVVDAFTAFCQMIEYGTTDMDITGVRNYMRLQRLEVWREDINKSGLAKYLKEKIDEGVGLGIFSEETREFYGVSEKEVPAISPLLIEYKRNKRKGRGKRS